MKLEVNQVLGDEWDRFVHSTPQATIFSTYQWVRMNARGGKPYFLTVRHGQEIVAGLSVIANDDKVAPPSLTQYNSILLRTTDRKAHENDSLSLDIQEAFATFLEGEFSSVRLVHHPSIRDIRVFQWRCWKERIKSTYVVDIRGIKGATARFRDSLRRQIKKKQRYGFEVAQSNCFETLLRLLDQSFRRHNARLFLERSIFQDLFQYCLGSERGILFTLQDGSKSAAAVFVVFDSTGVAYYFTAGADSDYLAKGAPSILLNDTLLELEQRGIHSFDFGGAHHPSIARFKSGFNPQLLTYFEVSYE